MIRTQAPHASSVWTRRDFLSASATGAGLLLLPGFLSRCGAAQVTRASEARALGSSTGYFADLGVSEDVVRRTLGEAMSRGGDFADLFFQYSDQGFVGLQDGEVNRAYASVSLGCGVRVVKGDQTGFAFTEDLSPEALLDAARTAATVSAGGASPVGAGFERLVTPSYYPVEIGWDAVAVDQKIPLLERADEVARATDPRVKKVTVFMGDTTEHVLIATSDGRLATDFQPMTQVYVGVVAEDGGRRESHWRSRAERRGFEFYSPEMMAQLAGDAASDAVVLFDATPPPAGEYPVVLAPGLSGILLHEAIGHGMEADFNRKGTSIFADKMGQRIAPEHVTIVDDGTNPHQRGSINVDDEGQETKRTVLVEDGKLVSYLHDRISAKHYGLAPTGNGRRESYRFAPVPRMRNTYMTNGPHDPEEIIRSVKKGIYAEQFTNGQVRIGSGDFSFYVKHGRMIEDGKLTRPIKDANLIGFGPKVLEGIEMVGTDMALYSGAGYCGKDGQRVPVGFGLPTTKCAGISVGGVG